MTPNTPTFDLYQALANAYSHFNERLFSGRLPDCLIVLQRQPRMMGYASYERWINEHQELVDELAINPEYFLGYPLLEVMQTLVHEQCHIWQHHWGTPSRRTYHNKEWGDKMESIGLMPSSTGRPGGRRTGQRMNDYVIYGGLFQKAFYELKDLGFVLPWLDRKPYREQQGMAASVYDIHGEPAMESLPSEEVALLQEHLGLVFTAPAAEPLKPQVQPPTPLSAANTGATLQFLPTLQEAAKKPTRVKYRCPGCHNQAWGKPNMALVCGDCEVNFVQS